MGIMTSAGRAVLGGYLAVHGSQKLFGAFGGHGLEGTGKMFESMGLTPGREMAMLAGASELAGGILTATGVADPLGPIAIAGAMTVATAVHRKAGPMAMSGGFELPLTNLALAAVLAAASHGPLGPSVRLPKGAATVVALVAAALAGVALAKLLTFQPEAEPGAEGEPATA